MSRAHPELEIREYRPGDEEQIVETFNRAFGAVDPNFRPRSMELWRWQYLGNPSRWRIWLAFTPEGRLVSQYAGVGQRMRLEGRPANFSQAVDSMTDPVFGRGLKRPGAFVLTGYPYAANYGGDTPERDAVMWGVPVRPAWRIGKAYLEYEFLRWQQKLQAPPAEVRARRAPGIEIEERADVPAEVEELFERCAPAYGAIAVRDRAQLDWRFTRHPEHDYSLLFARRGDALAGLAVFRLGTFDGVERQGLVCDWLVPPDDAAAREHLVAALAARARSRGAEALVAAFPDTASEWLWFQELGLRAAPTRHFLVGRNYTRRHDMRWLYHHWYYTLGDTDLV